MRVCFSILASFLISTLVHANEASDISLKLIKELTRPQNLEAKYTIANQYSDGRADQKMAFEVKRNKNNYFQRSDREEILVSGDLFIKNNILRKTIFVSHFQKNQDKTNAGIIDTTLIRFFKNAEVISSQLEDYQIRISFPKGMMFQSLFVEADLKQKKLKKVIYQFNPVEVPFQKSCTIIFSEFNIRPKFSKQSFSSKQYFLSSGNALIPVERFKGFQILDQRASL